MTRFLRVALAALLASCDDGPVPPLDIPVMDVGALSGRYRVTLALDPGSRATRTCGQLEVTIGAQVTWEGLDCAIQEAGGGRDAARHEITLSHTTDVPGGGTATRQAYRFFFFSGTQDRVSSYWVGPACATPCANEGGTSAEWVRQ